jgi:hypothetical protein
MLELQNLLHNHHIPSDQENEKIFFKSKLKIEWPLGTSCNSKEQGIFYLPLP